MVVITVIEKSRAPEKSQGDWGISFPSNPWASAATTSLWYCLTIVSTSRLQLPGWRRLYFSVMFQSSSTVSSRTLTILCGELVSKSSNSCFCIFYLTIILIHYKLDIRLPIKDHFRDDFSFYFYIRGSPELKTCYFCYNHKSWQNKIFFGRLYSPILCMNPGI